MGFFFNMAALSERVKAPEQILWTVGGITYPPNQRPALLVGLPMLSITIYEFPILDNAIGMHV